MHRSAAIFLLGVFGAGATAAQEPSRQEKQIVPLIKSNWVAFRNYSGHQFVYFTNLLAYRCGIAEIRYSINSEALDGIFPLPPCDPAQPYALDATKYPPFLMLASGTARQVAVQVELKDRSLTDIVRLKPCGNAGEDTCAALAQ